MALHSLYIYVKACIRENNAPGARIIHEGRSGSAQKMNYGFQQAEFLLFG